MSHPHSTQRPVGGASRTRQDLLRELEEREAEAGLFHSLLAPLLQRMGGDTVLTMADMLAAPEGHVVWTEMANTTDIHIWLAPPKEES